MPSADWARMWIGDPAKINRLVPRLPAWRRGEQRHRLVWNDCGCCFDTLDNLCWWWALRCGLLSQRFLVASGVPVLEVLVHVSRVLRSWEHRAWEVDRATAADGSGLCGLTRIASTIHLLPRDTSRAREGV